MKRIITALIFLCLVSELFSQSITLPVAITDGITIDTIKFGIHPDATNGIDNSLGEEELPPPPPSGIFDARFIGDGIGIPIGQGIKKDLRQGVYPSNMIRIHRIKYQMGFGITAITLRWSFPTGVSVHMYDAVNGSIVNTYLHDTGSYVITFASVLPIMNFDITYGPDPVELNQFWSTTVNNDVYLKWLTGSEMNNRGFEIQRKKDIEEEWSFIGFVAGAVNSNELKEYEYADQSLNQGSYNYRLKQIDLNGNYEYFLLNEVVNIGRPNKFALFQNYPNPFNPTTTISYQLSKPGMANLSLYDSQGKLVQVLLNEFRNAGTYEFELDAGSLSSGVYYYSLLTKDYRETKSLVLMK